MGRIRGLAKVVSRLSRATIQIRSELGRPPAITEQPDPSEPESVRRLINDELTKRLEVQRQAGKDLDTKAAIVAAASLTGLQFVAGRTGMNGLLVLASIIGLALAALNAYWCLRVREFNEVPEPEPFVKHYRDKPTALVLAKLSTAKVRAFEWNGRIYKEKATFVRRSFLFMGFSAGLMALAQLIGTRWQLSTTWSWLVNHLS